MSRIQKHYSKDLLVNSNGTVTHDVLLKTVVGCDVDMFKYPFVEDTCPISLNAWNADGKILKMDRYSMTVYVRSIGQCKVQKLLNYRLHHWHCAPVLGYT